MQNYYGKSTEYDFIQWLKDLLKAEKEIEVSKNEGYQKPGNIIRLFIK